MLLLTGAAGFIGSNFVHVWARNSDEPLVVLDKLTYAGNPANLDALPAGRRPRLVQGDIGDRALVGRLLDELRPRAVVNFAAESHVDRSIRGPEAFVETNVVGTFRLLEAVRAHWAALSDPQRDAFRLLHVSTDEVYGTLGPDAPPFREDTAYAPNSPYAASKAASDHFVRAWVHTYGIPAVTTNCSNNYGPYHFPEKLIPLVITNALAGRTLPVYGDGQQIRDWLFVEDHCRAIARVLAAGRVGETYNVGGRSERTNLAVVQTVCTLLDDLRPRADGRPYAEQIRFVADRPGHDRRYAVDATKIERELGWVPAETFESGLRKTVAWYLAHPEWVHAVASGAYRAWVAEQYAGTGA